MKRVLAFASALALAVGAFAPAAFAADSSSSSIISLDDLDDDTFDSIITPFDDSDLYDRDSWINKFVDSIGANMVALSNSYPLLDTFFQDVPGINVLYGTAKLKALFQNVGIDTSTGEIVSLGDDMSTDLLDQYLDSTLKSSAGSVDVSVGTGTWTYVPANSVSSWIRANAGHNIAYNNLTSHEIWVGRFLYNGNSWGTVVCSYISGGTVRLCYNSLGSYDTFSSWSTYATGKYYISRGISESNISNTHSYYSSLNAALADFFDNSPSTPSGSWNGKGYYDTSRQFNINLPAVQGVDWSNLSHKYYTEYGPTFVDSSSVDNNYYNIANNYAPYEVTYNIPYWLLNGNTSVIDFNYSLELPSVDLYELPSEFSGGDEVWDSSFTMLGGFGAFILLGFSFGLVALFFKD